MFARINYLLKGGKSICFNHYKIGVTTPNFFFSYLFFKQTIWVHHSQIILQQQHNNKLGLSQDNSQFSTTTPHKIGVATPNYSTTTHTKIGVATPNYSTTTLQNWGYQSQF